jgi:hypothetical protein
LDLYRLADLFHLTLLEKAVIDFLVKHLSELLKSRPEDVLTLPYCLLQEVLKSDRLTSLSEEQIWQVRTWCLTSGRWDMIRKGRTLEQQPLFDEAWLSVVLKPCSLVKQVTEGYQVCSPTWDEATTVASSNLGKLQKEKNFLSKTKNIS